MSEIPAEHGDPDLMDGVPGDELAEPLDAGEGGVVHQVSGVVSASSGAE